MELLVLTSLSAGRTFQIEITVTVMTRWSGELGWNHLLFVYEDYTHIPRLHIKLHRRPTPFPLSSNYASGAH
jgi:hypothetical protein